MDSNTKKKQAFELAQKMHNILQQDKVTDDDRATVKSMMEQHAQLEDDARQLEIVEKQIDRFQSVPEGQHITPNSEGGVHSFNQKDLDVEDADDADKLAVANTREYKRAFKLYLKKGIDELMRMNPKEYSHLKKGFMKLKTLNTVVGSQGGFLVHGDFNNTLIEERADASNLRGSVTTVQTSSNPLQLTRVEGATGTNAGVYPNGITITFVNSPTSVESGRTKPTFGTLDINVHNAVAKTLLALDLVDDSEFNIEAALPRWYGIAMGLDTDYRILLGSGVGEPTGLLVDPDVKDNFFVTSAGVGDIEDNDLINLVYALESQYANTTNTGFAMSRQTLKKVRLFQDSEGRYIWQPGLTMGEPESILGFPIRETPFMPIVATGNFPIAFGDWSYYTLAERKAISINVIREKYIEELKLGYMAHYRLGGSVTVARAFRLMKIA